MTEDFRCGYVALVGRPNVGKSTLLNRILGQKISITSRKPQTTRHRILGIKTTANAQALYVDTPGIHQAGGRALNRALNRAASDALQDVDVIVFLVEATQWTAEDDLVLSKLGVLDVPVILALNKVDRVKRKETLLPYLQSVSGKGDFVAVVPLSAQTGNNVDELERQVYERLPRAGACFPEDQLTDRSMRFLAAELVREKLFRSLGQELPYGLTVEIERFQEQDGLIKIHALIWVEKASHKPIVIGRKGQGLKTVGRQAREEMERLFDSKVHLELWVKVKQGWADDERALRSLGIDE